MQQVECLSGSFFLPSVPEGWRGVAALVEGGRGRLDLHAHVLDEGGVQQLRHGALAQQGHLGQGGRKAVGAYSTGAERRYRTDYGMCTFVYFGETFHERSVLRAMSLV